MRDKFHRETEVWLKAGGLSAGNADPSAFYCHQKTDAASVKVCGEAEEAATKATTAITVEAVFDKRLDHLRHIQWCAAFVVYMQRHHPEMIPKNLQAPPDAMSWDDVCAAAKAAREGT